MKTILRNFLFVLRRYKLAMTLNILGLTIAFAAFMVIMMQVDYDRNFDRFHKDADRIYRMDLCQADGSKQAIISRPFSDAVIQSSPHILVGTICNPFGSKLFFSVENNGNRNSYQESSLEVTPSFTDVFTLDMLEGTDKALDDPEKALIPQSLSQKLFGGETAVGKQLVTRYKNYTVGGVYKDFPLNSSVQNVIYTSLDPKENLTNWDNWNYSFFVRVDAPENVAGLFENFKNNFDGEILKKAFGEEFSWDMGLFCQFTALPELHFTTDVQYDSTPKSSRQTMLILLAIAFVIVAIAGINFTNFSTALTPKRIRSINTQKVLGGETWVIRTSLVTEGIVISFCSYLLALGLICLAKDTSLVSLVDADLSLTAHWGLVVATSGLAILTGLLAGLYPAYYITSFQPALVLKGSFGLSPRGRQLRSLLISVQFIASFTLIIGASFMYLQNYYMQHTPLGYDKDELIVTTLNRKVLDSRDAFTNQLKNFSGIEDVPIRSHSFQAMTSIWVGGVIITTRI